MRKRTRALGRSMTESVRFTPEDCALFMLSTTAGSVQGSEKLQYERYYGCVPTFRQRDGVTFSS